MGRRAGEIVRRCGGVVSRKAGVVIGLGLMSSAAFAQNTPVDLGAIEFPITPASIAAAVFVAVGALWSAIYVVMIGLKMIKRFLNRSASAA